MWPPSDPEMMLSASSDKAEITYCSVWAVAIVSASGMTEGSKENPSIWCSISPDPSASLCLYLPVSPKASPPPAHLACMLSCCLVLGPVLQGLFSNALRNYFLFCYKQGQSPSAAQPGPAGAAGHPREKNSLYHLSTAKKPETRPHIVDRCPAHCHASC